MNDTFMKTRPVFPLLLSMALPNVISMLVNSLYNIVDSLFVAQISEQAMTALSLVFPIQNFVNAVAIGFGIGINAQIALYLGAGDHENANRAATHGMMFSLLHGVLGMVLCIAIMPGFLRRFTTDPALVDMGVTYSTIVFLFSLVNMADLAFEKIFQSVGRMNVAMVALITGCVTNIALDPVLIFGLGPVPALGIAGAALATGIGQAVSLVVYLYVYCTTEIAVRFSRRCLRFDAALDGKLYAIGVPAILNLALPSLLVTFLNGLLAVYSQSYVTVLGMGQARLIVDGKVRTAACIGGMLAVADGKVRLVPTTFEWAEDIDLTRARHAKEYAEAYLNSHPGETDSREYRHFAAKYKRALIRIAAAQR